MHLVGCTIGIYSYILWCYFILISVVYLRTQNRWFFFLFSFSFGGAWIATWCRWCM